MRVLMENNGRVVTRQTLLDKVWGYDFEGEQQTVSVHIRWLREKIEEDSRNAAPYHHGAQPRLYVQGVIDAACMTSLDWALPAAAIIGLIGGGCWRVRYGVRKPPAEPPPAPVAPLAPVESRRSTTHLRASCARCRSASCLVDLRGASSLPTPRRAAIFGFDTERAIGSHVIEAIPNVEVERRITDALQGEASVAPLTLTSSEGAAHLPRLRLSAVGEGEEPAVGRGLCRRSNGPRAARARAQRVSFERFARVAHAAVVDQADAGNGAGVARR